MRMRAHIIRPMTARRIAPVVGAVLAVAVAVALGGAGAARADNGRIAFEVPPDSAPSIATVNPDGTGQQFMPGVPRNTSANPAWSADGTRLAFESTVSGRSQIYVVNEDGTGLWQVTNDAGAAVDPSFSPDGTQIVYAGVRFGLSQIYVVNLKGCTPPAPCGNVTQLTTGPGINQQPRWSPDGNRIAFASTRTGSFQIFTMTPAGAGQQQLTTSAASNTDPAWSPGRGAQLAYTSSTPDGTQNIYAISRAGGAARQITSDGISKFPAWAPDGQAILYTSGSGLISVQPSGTALDDPVIVFDAVDAVWAPVVPPAATRATGTVTVTLPGQSPMTISSASGAVTNPATAPGAPSALALTTGTLVDATAGTVKVNFRAATEAPTVTPSTAVVAGLAVKVGATTTQAQTLQLSLPGCGQAAVVARNKRRRGRRGSGNFNGSHLHPVSNQVGLGAGDPTYRVVITCTGTRVTVSAGAVVATYRHGRHRHVLIRAGHTKFFPAVPAR